MLAEKPDEFESYEAWREGIRATFHKWALYDAMVAATSFEEYLAGDLPKQPTEREVPKLRLSVNRVATLSLRR
jgi:hypothetical protein